MALVSQQNSAPTHSGLMGLLVGFTKLCGKYRHTHLLTYILQASTHNKRALDPSDGGSRNREGIIGCSPS